jgi:hypothetical protein
MANPSSVSLLFSFSILKKLFWPNLLAALTTCIGFLTLLTVKVPLVKQYVLSTSLAVVATWALTSITMLVLLPLLPPPVARSWTGARARWTLYILKYKRVFTYGLISFSMICALGAGFLNWSPRLLDDLPKKHPTRLATENIDKHLGGLIPQDIILEAGKKLTWDTPQAVVNLDALLGQLRKINGIGSATGLSDVLKMATPNFNLSRVSKNSLAEMYFLFSLAPENPLRAYFSSDGKTTRISLRLNDVPAERVKNILRQATQMAQYYFPDHKVTTVGMANNAHRLNSTLSHELIFGFWQALFAIFILLIFVFKSLRWSLLACAPNLVSPALLLGALAVLDTPVKPGIALVFSIAIGISFNNTVYLLERLRSQPRCTPSGIRRAFYLESNACLVSTLVIFVGFVVFLGSYFSLNRYFGAFMLLSILGGLIGDLILLPALLALHPSLLNKKLKAQKSVLKPTSHAPGAEPLPSNIAASILLVFILGLTGFGTNSQADNKSKGKILLEEAAKAISAKDESAEVTLKIIEAGGDVKERKVTIKRKGGKKSHVLVRLQDPPDLRGTAFLSHFSEGSEEQWLYLPSTKSVRRIVGSGKSSGFLGSEITYDDLSASSAKGAEINYLKETKLGGIPVYVVDILGNKKVSAYSKVRTYISLDRKFILRGEYFDWSGKLLKVLTFEKYKKYPGGVWRAAITRIKNVQNKRATELIINNLRGNQNLPDSDFSQQALESD